MIKYRIPLKIKFQDCDMRAVFSAEEKRNKSDEAESRKS